MEYSLTRTKKRLPVHRAVLYVTNDNTGTGIWMCTICTVLHSRYIFPNGKWRGAFFFFQNTPHELKRYCTDGFSFCASYPYLILCSVWVCTRLYAGQAGAICCVVGWRLLAWLSAKMTFFSLRVLVVSLLFPFFLGDVG